MTKKLNKWLIAMAATLSASTLVFAGACGGGTTGGTTGGNDDSSKHTVTFYVDGTEYATKKVANNKRITDVPANPTFADSSKVFTAWYETEDFSGAAWNMQTGIVSKDMSLYAGYRTVSLVPTDLAMKDEACTSTIVWTQAAAGEYTVTLNGSAITGSTSYDSTTNLVSFVPATIPQGGVYTVVVTDNAHSESPITANLSFGGAGTQTNPYLINTAKDFTAVSQANVPAGEYYQLNSNITIKAMRADQKDYEFNGTLIGNGKTISHNASNCGAISKIGANGVVKSLTVDGSISTANDGVGALADVNDGRVEKVSIAATVTSTAGTVGSNGYAKMANTSGEEGTRGIVGGVVGINNSTGIVYNCSTSSTVKAAMAGGGIVGYNYGTVQLCDLSGTIGAGNALENGKSTSAYSYCGGIVGVNAGTVTECQLTGSGKMLAQRNLKEETVVAGTTNYCFGGIVGLNLADGEVSVCSNVGIRVHADEVVGGIAGINEGSIKDCIIGGIHRAPDSSNINKYVGYTYVGGRKNVGAIAGLNSGSVANCVALANVYSYTEGTAYAVAEGNVTNCVYLSANVTLSNTYGYNAEDVFNPLSAELTAPADASNVAVAEAPTLGSNVALDAKYLETVNGNSKFVHNGTTIAIVMTVVPEDSVVIELKDGETSIGNATVKESAAAISAPKKKGFKFLGWALTADGEVVYAAGENVSYYDVYNITELYAIYEGKEPDTTLNVSVWHKDYAWVTEDEINAIKSDFNAYLTARGIDVSTVTINWTIEEKTGVADLGASVNNAGNIDIVIGCGSNITSTGKVEYIDRANILTSIVAANRMVATLTDNTLAEHLYNYLTKEATSGALRVGYYYKNDTAVSEEQLTAIKTAFETANPGITIEWVQFKLSTKNYPLAAMIDDMIAWNSDADETNNIDCVINFGNNFNTTNGATAGVPVTIVGEKVQVGTRYVAQLTDTDASLLFFVFAQTDETLLGL